MFYFLFIVFLYAGESNARVVPLDFIIDKSKHVDLNILENEVIDKSPPHKIEILGHGIPDVEQSNDLKLSNSEKNSTTFSEISTRNTSSQSLDVTIKGNDTGEDSNVESAESSELSDVPDEEFKSVSEFIRKKMDEESRLESAESSELSDILDEEFKSVSEFISENNLDFKDSFETLLNENLNDKTEDLTYKNEASVLNSSRDLEQGNNLVLKKFEEKILNDTLNQNETFSASDVINRDQNETFAVFEIVNGTNSSDNFQEVQSLSNDTKVVFLSDAKNITEDFKSGKMSSGNLELTNDSVQTAGGILSGFEFLINSEVARNAAKAMEVFNFSDPLTDHIIEENEFHSFLPSFNAGQGFDSSNQTDLKTAIIINSSVESNETRPDFNTSLPFGDETSLFLNEAEPEETKNDSSIPFNPNKLLEERNNTELPDLADNFEGNSTPEAASLLENFEEKIQLPSEASPSKQKINASVTVSSTVVTPKCPPPGWCVFGFFSQDTCAINEHCLGSRICCKIGCSKTCIEVESP